MKTIEPMLETFFERKLKKEAKWKSNYDVITMSYRELSPNFEIQHDRFGGYWLIYKKKTVLRPTAVLRRNPVCFVAAIPDGVVTDPSVMSSERTGEQLLLLGPLRFVNSDCTPNCEYNFTSDCGIVQLKVKRRISPGKIRPQIL